MIRRRLALVARLARAIRPSLAPAGAGMVLLCDRPRWRREIARGMRMFPRVRSVAWALASLRAERVETVERPDGRSLRALLCGAAVAYFERRVRTAAGARRLPSGVVYAPTRGEP